MCVGLNDQDTIALGAKNIEGVKNKRKFFKYRVVAPSCLFPDPSDDENSSDATLSPEHQTQMPSPTPPDEEEGLLSNVLDDVVEDSQPLCDLLKPDLKPVIKQEELSASQEAKLKKGKTSKGVKQESHSKSSTKVCPLTY